MPASANWPERTLISPILTVPCALADETPSTSATAQPSPTRIRFIVILPACSLPNNCKKNCTHESLRGREVRRPRRWAPPHLRNGVTRGCNVRSRPRFRPARASAHITRPGHAELKAQALARAPHGLAAAYISRGKGLDRSPSRPREGHPSLVTRPAPSGSRCSKPLKR